MSGVGGMSRTGRGRERARAEIAVVRVLEKRLGALPVVAGFGRRLRIAEIVDELCPVRPVAWISHGEVIEALVANRLTAPAPLVRVQEWAAAMAVDEAYGISPELLWKASPFPDCGNCVFLSRYLRFQELVADLLRRPIPVR